MFSVLSDGLINVIFEFSIKSNRYSLHIYLLYPSYTQSVSIWSLNYDHIETEYKIVSIEQITYIYNRYREQTSIRIFKTRYIYYIHNIDIELNFLMYIF